MLTLAVAVAAGLGAVLRYVIDQLVQHRTRGDFPTAPWSSTSLAASCSG